MLIKLYSDNPNERQIRKVTEVLRNGGVIIYPTDSVYAFGCDLMNYRAFEKISKIKRIDLSKANLSVVCYDLSHISDFTVPLNNNVYKIMKKNLPGPFTFILKANNNVPKIFRSKKKTIGIRIPDNNIARSIVFELGNPLITTSVHDEDELLEYTTDPELINEKFSNNVDLIIDGGYGNNIPSTIVDCSQGEVEILREGIGELMY